MGPAHAKAAEIDFRWQLKLDCRAEHARLDALMSGLDLTEADDLSQFLETHLIAFRAMNVHMVDQSVSALITALDTDLTTLGHPTSEQDGLDMTAFHPLAGRYIVSGSRLGTQVLRKRWAASNTLRVRSASQYFSQDANPREWQAVCADLARIEIGSAEATQITLDVRRIFEGFSDAFVLSADKRSVLA